MNIFWEEVEYGIVKITQNDELFQLWKHKLFAILIWNDTTGNGGHVKFETWFGVVCHNLLDKLGMNIDINRSLLILNG